MIKVIILKSLREEILRKFKKEAIKIYKLLNELKDNPAKGKNIGIVGSILIKELKYKTFRFYLILENQKLILFNKEKISELLIKFIRMSKKNNQQNTINEIKKILKEIGFKEIK